MPTSMDPLILAYKNATITANFDTSEIKIDPVDVEEIIADVDA